RVRAGARRLVDDYSVVERHGAGQVDWRPEARDIRGPTGEIRPMVDESLIDPVDAVVLAVTGVLEAARDQDGVLGREFSEHGGKQRLLMEVHIVVIAAAIVAREARARRHVRGQ